MLETREKFDAHNEIKKHYMSAIEKVKNLLPIIKERSKFRRELSKESIKQKGIQEDLECLKKGLLLVESVKLKKVIEEKIPLKEDELNKSKETIKNINNRLLEIATEIEEYKVYINFVFDFSKEFIIKSDIEFNKFSIDDFIAFTFIHTKFGKQSLMEFEENELPKNLQEFLDVTSKFTWEEYIRWLETK